jgi:uncharacterized membrane protein
MLRPVLIGLVAGMRSMTPLAAVSLAARTGRLPARGGAWRLLGAPAVVAGSAALAVGELAGDKLPSAPDRIVAPGIAARLVSGALAGAAVAPRGRRAEAMAVGAATAVAASYLTFGLRMIALRRYGQARSGLVEDALALAGALAVAAAGPGRDAATSGAAASGADRASAGRRRGWRGRPGPG